MEAWLFNTSRGMAASANSSSLSLPMQQFLWVLFVLSVSFLGVFSIPLFMLVVYMFQGYLINRRYGLWMALSSTCQVEILTLTESIMLRDTHYTDREWFGQVEHFVECIRMTMKNVQNSNSMFAFSRSTEETRRIRMIKAQLELLKLVELYMTFKIQKDIVELAMENFVHEKHLYEEEKTARKEQLRSRLRRELKWKTKEADVWEESGWLRKLKWYFTKDKKVEENQLPRSSLCSISPDGEDRCCICLEEYQETDDKEMVQAKCSHIFHEDCLLEWLGQKTNKCPYCRADILRSNFLVQLFQP